jgi:glycosyltransferase involved in cell wall biosynthesis
VTVLSGSGYWGRIRSLRRELKRFRPDVVHTAIFEADVIGRIAAIGTRVPVVSSLVNTPYDPVRRADPRVRPWRLAVLRVIDGVTGRRLVTMFHAVSQGVADANIRALRLRPERVRVVDRGRPIDQLGERTTERRERVRRALDVADDDIVLLAVGRQEYQKAHVDLIAALDTMLAKQSRALLLVAGRDGNATPDIAAALAAHPAAAARTRLLGHRDDVGDLLAAADLFVMPSKYEGTAGAALEAMAMSLPIVVTDVEGLRGVLVHDQNAVLVPAGDVAALAAALLRLTEQPERAHELALRAKADFDARFRLDRSVESMIALYRHTLDVARR